MDLTTEEKKTIRNLLKNDHQNKTYSKEELINIVNDLCTTSKLTLKKQQLIENISRYVHTTKDNEIYRINIAKTNKNTDDIFSILKKNLVESNISDIDESDSDSDSDSVDSNSDIDSDFEFNYTNTYNNTKTDKRPTYKFPLDSEYEVVRRNNIFDGPFGTDWYHDKEQKDDEWRSIHKRRAKLFKKLRNIELPVQRSPDWFKMRNEKITASDGGAIIGYNKHEQPFWFLKKKTMEIPFETNIHCYHGKKLEEPATMIYEYRMNVKIEEFGLMGHPTIRFLGASPDGIVSEYKLDGKHKTKYVGRMLEIKCPAIRKINLYSDDEFEVCPKYYWAQVQLQLQCCELDECDFWQCKLDEYDGFEDFLADTDDKEPFRTKSTGYEKGCLIQLIPRLDSAKLVPFINEIKKIQSTIDRLNNPKASEYKGLSLNEKNKLINENEYKLKIAKRDYKDHYDQIIFDKATFIYPPKIDMSPYDCLKWINEQTEKISKDPMYGDVVFDCVKYWRLIESKNITIKRNDKWFEEQLPIYEKNWNYVEFLRNNPRQCDIFHRAIQQYDRKHKKGNDVAFELLEKLINVKEKGYKKWLNELDDTIPKLSDKYRMKTWEEKWNEKKELEKLKYEEEKENVHEILSDFAFF